MLPTFGNTSRVLFCSCTWLYYFNKVFHRNFLQQCTYSTRLGRSTFLLNCFFSRFYFRFFHFSLSFFFSVREDMENAIRKLDDTEMKNPFDATFIRVKSSKGGKE